MKISRFTDLGLKVLLYLSQEPIPLVTMGKVAQDLGVSKSHLVKVVNFMAKQQWLLTMKGVCGGIALAKLPQDYLLGDVIRALEQQYHGDSIGSEMSRNAVISALVQEGLEQVYQQLNQYHLADVAAPKTRVYV